jgi:hypothetical protein|tara:strand:+ start:648 stop:1181 length:534 start_codon:yes stop_codon:yes gene_type:complete
MAYSNKPSRVNKSRNLTLANRPSGGNLRQRLNSAASLGAVRNTVLSPLGENSNLRREAFNRKQFDDTIDTSFSELGVNNVDPSTFDPSLATVGDFFTIYQTLFYQIPKVGDINSHEFLIKESTEYTQFRAQQDEIDALLAEIDELRAQNVTLVADMTNTISNLEDAFTAAQANNNAG